MYLPLIITDRNASWKGGGSICPTDLGRVWHPSAWLSVIPQASTLAVLYIIKENLLGRRFTAVCTLERSRCCSIVLHLWDPINNLSSFLFHSLRQKGHLYSAFNSVMPDNIEFIYGKLIRIHWAGLLVCTWISLNQQTIYSALMYSSRWAVCSPLLSCDLLDPGLNACK